MIDLTTRGATEHWKVTAAERGADWIPLYQRSGDLLSRRYLLGVLRRLPPWTSLLEVGAHCGINLDLVTTAFPAAEVLGIDVSPEAVAASTAPALVADMMDYLPRQQRGSWDIVLSHNSLCYIHPDDLAGFLAECRRVARVAVICVEMGLEPDDPDPSSLIGTERPDGVFETFPSWRHNYVQVLQHTLGVSSGVLVRLPPVTDEGGDAIDLNMILVISSEDGPHE